ncbi:kinase-like domain-containing protein [Suillus ampliporus]|nr:kinase-like domain-containing protein [Suillus ampliporus]
MWKMKCTDPHCDVVLERYKLPHHIREVHPLIPNRNAPEFRARQSGEAVREAVQEAPPVPIITQLDRESFKRKIQDIVQGFNALPDQLRQACRQSVGNMPVLGALYAYTFTHLQLCAPEKQSLIAELENLKAEWMRGGDTCLLSLKAVKDGLVHILQMSQVKKHVCNTRLVHEHRLHELDINNIGALIIEHTTSNEHARAFYTLTDDNAQFMVEMLQNLLAAGSGIVEGYRKYLVNAVIKLSRKSGRFPQSLQLCRIHDLKDTDLRGGYGSIFQGKLNGRLVAVKKVRADRRSPHQFHKEFSNEAVVWYFVRHPNCLPFYGVYVFDDAGVKTWCLVSPWMADGHVKDYLQKNPDADRLPLILDVACGLKYLHSMEPAVSHGDLKGVNILITSSGRACIADFGIVMARDSHVQLTTTTPGAGTTCFMAPELLNAQNQPDLLQNLDKMPCDMYALGCVCYEMYTGMAPFQNLGAHAGIQVLQKRRPGRPLGVVDDFMWNFIEALWKHTPTQRLTAAQACEGISHKMQSEGGTTARPFTEVEWDVGFLADTAVTMVTEDPFTLAHT